MLKTCEHANDRREVGRYNFERMPNGPRSRIFQLSASDHPHYTGGTHPTYLETTPQSPVPTVGGGRVFGQLWAVHDARTLSLA